ncbi:MAG TPA: DinB family protein [Thermoanaerobaculia bacterium]|nr:DinB family protein [Thermoanaerobaculia bacterium]
MRATARQPAIAALLHAIDEAYDKAGWHGTNLRGSLRGVAARQADWRPSSGRHNIRELVVHAAYWKRRVRDRLTGATGDPFPIRGSNWLKLPAATEKAWRVERELLDSEHRSLREVVAGFPAARLRSPLPGFKRRTALREIAGVALHDAYHTGQIQLVKTLWKKGGRS